MKWIRTFIVLAAMFVVALPAHAVAFPRAEGFCLVSPVSRVFVFTVTNDGDAGEVGYTFYLADNDPVYSNQPTPVPVHSLGWFNAGESKQVRLTLPGVNDIIVMQYKTDTDWYAYIALPVDVSMPVCAQSNKKFVPTVSSQRYSMTR